MNPINFPEDDNITYHYFSWKELGELTEELAYKILKTNTKIDRIVALATGGLTMSRLLKDYLGIKKLSSIQVEFYTSINKTKTSPIITQSLPLNIDGEDILIFDDINDTGNTLIFASKYLKLRGAKTIHTATVFQKPHTKNPSNFFQQQTSSWVIFPDEVRESITILANKWRSQSMADDEIKTRLKQIGFTQKQIDNLYPTK